jgi:hypothetical protein
VDCARRDVLKLAALASIGTLVKLAAAYEKAPGIKVYYEVVSIGSLLPSHLPISRCHKIVTTHGSVAKDPGRPWSAPWRARRPISKTPLQRIDAAACSAPRGTRRTARWARAASCTRQKA